MNNPPFGLRFGPLCGPPELVDSLALRAPRVVAYGVWPPAFCPDPGDAARLRFFAWTPPPVLQSPLRGKFYWTAVASHSASVRGALFVDPPIRQHAGPGRQALGTMENGERYDGCL
jgi:hypothetical protein